MTINDGKIADGNRLGVPVETVDIDVQLPDPSVKSEDINVVIVDPDQEDGGEGTSGQASGDEGELRDYSDRVQKRIAKKHYEREQFRREAEKAARERDESVRIAQILYEENQRLRELTMKGDAALKEQALYRIGSEIEQASSALRKAHDEGDTEALVKAQRQLADLSAKKAQLETYRPQAPAPVAARPQQPGSVASGVDDKTREWISRNPWFEKDPVMTRYAIGLHVDLVNKGVRPGTDEYIAALDRGMSEGFPGQTGGSTNAGGGRQSYAPARPPVGAPSRAPGKPSQTVQLTQTQVAIARQLGVDLKDYAAALLKEKRNG